MIKMEKKEKRGNERLDISLEVYGEEGNLIGSIINISYDGCFIKTQKSFNKNKNILPISIALPCSHHKIDIACEVVWNQKNGIGAKFIMDDHNRSIFTSCIDSLSKFKRVNRPIEKSY